MSWYPTKQQSFEVASISDNSICLYSSIANQQVEMIRIGPDGFWVRGVKVEQDNNEAESVYSAFKEFLAWNVLTR